ncbi:sensor histidine kinase [Bacteroidia bacterium]|nr:sensor histidine kinase [Bacteroidia bacterium]GHT46893.1 sensor histidine kinase [Bacteroidia bacterium]
MNTEMQHEAMLHPGITLDIQFVSDDTEKQIADIQNFIDKKVDLIIVSPNVAAPITPVIEKAYAAGIPVVLVDRKILSDNYTAFIGADNYQIGKEVGNYVVKLLGGKGNIVEIRGLEGSSPVTERHQGFISVIHNYPEINTIYEADGAWLQEIAGQKMTEVLAGNPDIDLVFAHNDRMAMGAYDAANLQDKANGIYFIGIDALPGSNGGIEQVLENKLKATFIYPTSGEKIIQLASNILQGKPYEKNNTLYTNVVDETNARVLKLQTDVIIEQENKLNFLDNRVDTYLSQYTTQRYLLLAAVFIVALFIGLSYFIFRAYRAKHRLNIELEKRGEQLVALSKQLEEATHAKLVFFTNISHEFRTPLTLISGPVSSLLADKTINVEQRRLLTLMQKNIGILMKLIDQIIDFRKYENGKLKLDLSPSDLKEQFIEWNESFREIAKRKHLNFHFNVLPDADFSMAIDVPKMERIYFNLLSNALKFTPEKGTVSVNLNKINQDNTDYAVIEVSNSGKGISEEDIQHIFDRFYQVDSHFAGSGIGLALTKAMVELHEGQIQVNSTADGWTTFTVLLPFRQKETQSQSVETRNTLSLPTAITPFDNETPNHRETVFDETRNDHKQLVLVVDDNPDIRSYIRMVMQNQYTIMESENGEEGFKKAVKHIPDIIISDVMMPKIDGIELCQKLKAELSTSHIPVILLTACSLDEQRITGFKSGADDYIAKPFNSDILEVRVSNLIESRKRLKALFRENLFSRNSGDEINEAEKTFLAGLNELIEKHLSDSALNVEDLGQHIGLSRTQLYRKVKSLTGYSPNELLRIMRLKKACALLSSSESNVAEVAYDTGFTSASYFAKCFKDYYNESPTDYLKRIR